MIKIRALGTKELKQVLTLLKQYGHEELEYSVLRRLRQLYVPLHVLSQLLPPQWQFMPGIYVAVARDDVMGLVWLTQDGHRNNRWSIDELIIDPDQSTYDIGTQLVNFVINRYGGGGVQTFLAYVDQSQDQALGLFKSCGFRRATRLHTYRHATPGELSLQADSIKGLREATRHDAEKLKALHTDMLPPEVRISLQRHAHDFNGQGPIGRASEKAKGGLFKRWVVDDPVRDNLQGAVDISSDNHEDYRLNIMLHPGWNDNAEALIHFGIQQVLSISKNNRIQIDVYDFDKATQQAAATLGFTLTATLEVLVKDYWILLQDDEREKLRSPLLLFSGETSPAVN